MINENIQLVAFDLDDTLAPSKSPLPPEMADALRRLLQELPVCVISGGNFAQFESQLLQGLAAPESLLEKLHLMPTCGTRYFQREDEKWALRYEEPLSNQQKKRVAHVLEESAKQLGLWEEHPWGEVIEDRTTQITFSALGQEAPLEAKRAWDPDGSKKKQLVELAAPQLPDLEVRGGGSTSVDVTAVGVDKAYGMRRLVESTGIPSERMLFVGDRLDPGGNDYPVKAAGWPTLAVDGWQQTVQVIDQLLSGEIQLEQLS